MRRKRCNPPPNVQGPDPNLLAHAVMDEAVARMERRLEAPPCTPDAERKEMFDLLAEACRLEGIPVVRTTS